MSSTVDVNVVKDFRDIPGFSRYKVSSDGTVINKEKGRILSGSKNPAGYHNFRLTGDDGHVLTWGRHRLLGYVFKTPTEPIEGLVINHENGVKGDDRLENLVWTTYRGNLEHAGENDLTEKCVPISVRDVLTGFVTRYPSIREYSRVSGLTKDAVVHRLKYGQTRVFPEMKQYRFAKDDTPWYVPSEADIANLTHGNIVKVEMRKIETGEILCFDKMIDLANHVGISPSMVTFWVNQPNQPVLPGLIQLKLKSDPTPWREVTNPELEIEKRSGRRAVRVIDAETGVSTTYGTAAECAKAIGLKPTALNYRLKSNGMTTFTDGKRYEYVS